MTTVAPLPTAKFTRRSTRRRSLDPLELEAMAHGFAGSATSWPGMDNPSARCWRTIAATDRFEAWVVAWPVGGSIELHDHGGSAGAVVIVSGTLVETSIRPDDGPPGTTSVAIDAGGQVVFGPEHVHDLVNHGPDPALSVHVYSPALHAMTYFEWNDRRQLAAVRTEEYREGLLVG
jgi:mannose-6-phosphate isomerase-like protein (cupin superfamily)